MLEELALLEVEDLDRAPLVAAEHAAPAAARELDLLGLAAGGDAAVLAEGAGGSQSTGTSASSARRTTQLASPPGAMSTPTGLPTIAARTRSCAEARRLGSKA